jgi:4-carboxymuconolactone decarboxylase
MSRLPALNRDALPPDSQSIWDSIVARRSGVAMRGPSSALMYVPTLAERVAAQQDYFTTDAELAPTDRELIILATVREAGARFGWARHEARAREVGLRPEAVEVLRALGPTDALTPHERTLVDLVRSLLREHAVPDDLYARALAELGQTRLVEAVALIGHYCLIGLTINAFAIPEDSPTF